MIVLDENLQVLRLGNPIAAWYPGRVCYITELHSGAIIKDEAIPTYLRQVKGATFVTTNVSDFWRRVQADVRYAIVCLSLPNERLREVPDLLRQLFRLPKLRTKALRMGKVMRVSRGRIQYYAASDKHVRSITWMS